MKTTQYLFLLFLFGFGASFSLKAQTEKKTEFDRNVTIEREYQPLIQDVKKINTPPAFLELKNPRVNPVYTLSFSEALKLDQGFVYLPPSALQASINKAREGLLRLGVGSGFNFLGDLAFPFLKKRNTKLDFIANHYTLMGNKMHSTSKAALNFNHDFGTLKLFAGLGGGYEAFDYYGRTYNRLGEQLPDSTLLLEQLKPVNFNNSDEKVNIYPDRGELGAAYRTALTRLNLYGGFLKTTDRYDSLTYKLLADYKLFSTTAGIKEQEINLGSNVEFSFLSGRVGIDGAMSLLLYNAKNKELDKLLSNYFILSLTPYYLLSGDDWDLRLGLSSNFVVNYGMPPSIVPDAYFEYRLFPQYLALYVGAGGEYKVNTFNAIYSENRFFAPDRYVQNTESPIQFYGGMKIKPFSGLLIDLYADYKYSKNQYFFVNKKYERLDTYSGDYLYANRFDVIYSDAGLLKLGAKLSYNYNDIFRFNVQTNYNHWAVSKLEHALHMPKLETDFSANVRVNSRLNLYGNLYSAQLRYAKIGDKYIALDSKLDINIGGSYMMEQWFSLFVRLNNLTNNKYEEWHGFKVEGFNLTAGAVVNF